LLTDEFDGKERHLLAYIDFAVAITPICDVFEIVELLSSSPAEYEINQRLLAHIARTVDVSSLMSAVENTDDEYHSRDHLYMVEYLLAYELAFGMKFGYLHIDGRNVDFSMLDSLLRVVRLAPTGKIFNINIDFLVQQMVGGMTLAHQATIFRIGQWI